MPMSEERSAEQEQQVPAPVDREPLDGLRAVEPSEDVDEGLGDVDAEQADDDASEDTTDDQPDWDALAERDPRSAGELLAELTEAEARRDEYLDDVRRARAEFDNFRKRMMREAQQARASGAAEVAARLLDVLDDFDRTVEAAQSSEDDGLRKGVEMVHGKLRDVLQASGLTRIDQTGVAFDPERHEAVQQVAADEPLDEPVVDAVLRPGYEFSGRVIRAAMVAVRQ